MNAYEYLEQVKDADAKIDAKRAEEKELWAIATSTTQANDGMPHASGVSDKGGNNAKNHSSTAKNKCAD